MPAETVHGARTRSPYGHENLIVGNTSPLIYRIYAVQQANHLLSSKNGIDAGMGPLSVSCTKALNRWSGFKVAGGLMPVIRQLRRSRCRICGTDSAEVRFPPSDETMRR